MYYIPLVQQIPGFVVTAATMKAALAKAGLSLQVCNGQGQPSAVAACVQRVAPWYPGGLGSDGLISSMRVQVMPQAGRRRRAAGRDGWPDSPAAPGTEFGPGT